MVWGFLSFGVRGVSREVSDIPELRCGGKGACTVPWKQERSVRFIEGMKSVLVGFLLFLLNRNDVSVRFRGEGKRPFDSLLLKDVTTAQHQHSSPHPPRYTYRVSFAPASDQSEDLYIEAVASAAPCSKPPFSHCIACLQNYQTFVRYTETRFWHHSIVSQHLSADIQSIFEHFRSSWKWQYVWQDIDSSQQVPNRSDKINRSLLFTYNQQRW